MSAGPYELWQDDDIDYVNNVFFLQKQKRRNYQVLKENCLFLNRCMNDTRNVKRPQSDLSHTLCSIPESKTEAVNSRRC